MILFKLKCGAEHEFEGWFRDGATYERQAKRGLIACPSCGDTAIEKAPKAPRLGRSAPPEKAPPSPQQLRRMLQQLRPHCEPTCAHVGEHFCEGARRSHH